LVDRRALPPALGHAAAARRGHRDHPGRVLEVDEPQRADLGSEQAQRAIDDRLVHVLGLGPAGDQRLHVQDRLD
jgi:hypothetical protein